MGILDNHKKKTIRYEKDDIKLFEPTIAQREEITKLISNEDNIKINQESLKVSGTVGSRIIRYIIKECTSIGAEIDLYTDEEFYTQFTDRTIELLLREIHVLLNEIIEDIQWNSYIAIETTSQLIGIARLNLSSDQLKKKTERLFKKNGLKLTYEEFVKNKDNPKELQKLLRNVNKTR